MKNQVKTKIQLIRELNNLQIKIDSFENPITLNNDLENKHIGSIEQKNIKSAEKHIFAQNEEILEYLKESRLFSPFPRRFIEQLLPISEMLEIPKGEKILIEGEENTRVYFLLRGEVSLYAEGQHLFNLRRIGDIFGERSVINNHFGLSTVIAKTPVKVFRIKIQDIGTFVDIETDEFHNILFRLFALIMADKLSLTTNKAIKYEITQSELLKEIEDHKQAEEALKNAHDELELKVDERTKDYKKAKEEAERSDKLKNEFLANISHELRTPMHSILSYSKFGIEKVAKASQEKNLNYFVKIRKAGERLMNYLGDLLDLSCLEAGTEVYQMKSVNIWETVSNSVSKLETVWREKNLKVKIESPLIPTIVVCDESKIDRVFRNLLSNAAKFTLKDKHITIFFYAGELSIGRPLNDKEMIPAITVSVKDDGIGIPEDELDSVFCKFIQSSKTKTGAGGTGLGLSICQEIIKAHNGKIWVENNPEGGSTFSFILPYEQMVS